MTIEEIKGQDQIQVQLESMLWPIQDDGYGDLHLVPEWEADQASINFINEDLH